MEAGFYLLLPPFHCHKLAGVEELGERNDTQRSIPPARADAS